MDTTVRVCVYVMRWLLLWYLACSSLAGVSRSTTMVVAYLMTVTTYGWEECLSAIKAVRSFVGPNCGFQQQLQQFQRTQVSEVSPKHQYHQNVTQHTVRALFIVLQFCSRWCKRNKTLPCCYRIVIGLPPWSWFCSNNSTSKKVAYSSYTTAICQWLRFLLIYSKTHKLKRAQPRRICQRRKAIKWWPQ